MDGAVEEGSVSRSEVTVPLCGCCLGCQQCSSVPQLGYHTSFKGLTLNRAVKA